MKVQDIKEIAKSHGIKVSRLKKADLIRAIQREEGNYACFATPYNEECQQMSCLWREDCLESTQNSH